MAAMSWPWRRKAAAPRYVDAVELLKWARRYAYDPMLPEATRQPYRHMLDQVGRMEWKP